MYVIFYPICTQLSKNVQMQLFPALLSTFDQIWLLKIFLFLVCVWAKENICAMNLNKNVLH